MQKAQICIPNFLNLDASPKYIGQDESGFILNQDLNINPNGGTNDGGTIGKRTPLPANTPACEIDQPAGENYTILKYKSPLTRENISGVLNTNGVNYFQRINANGQCEIAYVGDCLKFSAAPRHSGEQWRCRMLVEKICKNWSGKRFVWTDGENPIGCIDFDASIATNFFTTPFFDICPDPCAYIQLCVPEICGCIKGEFVPLTQADLTKTNFIKDKAFKFMVQHIYYDGRRSIFSDVSSLYYQSDVCLQDGLGLSRCIKLRLPVGNPMVDRIRLAYTEDGGTTWYEYDIIQKYKAYNNTQQQWYERELSEIVSSTFSDTDCSFDYVFCNDKNRKIIPIEEVSRVRNPMPRKPQGMFNLDEALAFYNYEDGVCPIAETETEKLKLEVDCQNGQICVPETVTVTVRAIIYNSIKATLSGFPFPFQPAAGLIYRLGGDTVSEIDNPNDTAYYDSESAIIGFSNLLPAAPSQRFYDNTRNFIVYIEGTDYWAEMTQWKSDAFFTNRKKVGTVSGFGSENIRGNVFNDLYNGGFYYQEAIFRVPKGTRGVIRMVNHQASDGSSARQSTSESVLGLINDIRQFKNLITQDVHAYDRNDITFNKHELQFDTCVGSVELNSAFLINDFSSPVYRNLPGQYPIVSGYATDNTGRPVEGLTLTYPVYSDAIIQGFIYNNGQFNVATDHNGYFSFGGLLNSHDIILNGETACGQWGVVHSELINTGGIVDYISQNVVVDDTIVNMSTDRYATPFIVVKDCNGNPLINYKVTITGSKSAITDGNGVAKFRVRNYKEKPRVISIFLQNANGCIDKDCAGNCNPCDLTLDTTLPMCFVGVPDLGMGTFTVNPNSDNARNGLKPGGSYPFGYFVSGNCGRLSAVYELPVIDIPRLQETLQYNFCKLKYNATGMVLPDWANCLHIVRGKNLNPFELQWVADSVERTIDGNLKITIQSLNDYNANYFEKTNTVYQYQVGDRVEFISNDGQILNAATNGILNYAILSPFYDKFFNGNLDEPANYFNQILVKDDGKLANIKAGAIIELQRPTQSSEQLIPYFGICVSIPVVQVDNGDGTTHGELLFPTGDFTTFDTYFIPRIINGAVYTFQHHSPSDFWGTKQTDTGKAYFVNQYETEKRYGRNITINSPTQINYFGDLIKTVKGIDQGDIMAAEITDNRIVLLICQKDSAIIQSANDLLQVGNNGQVIATSPDKIFTDPQPLPVGVYGCQYDHIGSIIFGDGYAKWADVNQHCDVVHNYSVAKNVSRGRIETYTSKRYQEIDFVNSNTPNDLDKLRFCVGEHIKTKNVYTTIKKLRDSGIFNEPELYTTTNNTVIYNPVGDKYLGLASFTPEGYSHIDLFDGNGCAFITYLNGLAYFHPIITNKWNEFYGVPCDQIVSVCLNEDQSVEKAGLAIEIQSGQKFFSSKVETDKPGYLSEIVPAKVKQFQRKWNAPFMGNKNSERGLYGTELPSGYYIKILLIKDNKINDIYNSIDNTKRTAFNELDQVLIKYANRYESGFKSG